MVHNGIEYGDMQLIAEAYDLLKSGLGLIILSCMIFAEWTTDELNSYLIEITDIFNYIDSIRLPLVDVILDSATERNGALDGGC